MAAQRLAQTRSSAAVSASAPPRPAAPSQVEPASEFDSPTVVASVAADPFEPQRTVMVAQPDIPSLARGPDKT